jgi:hypothetical protein
VDGDSVEVRHAAMEDLHQLNDLWDVVYFERALP